MLIGDKMKKKAQGLSLNVIIVAAIALIVLIVLWAIFTGRMGTTVSGIDTAEKDARAAAAAIGSTGVSSATYTWKLAVTTSSCELISQGKTVADTKCTGTKIPNTDVTKKNFCCET